MQCGTNQLGEQQILPAATARGIAVERWSMRTRVIENLATGPTDGTMVKHIKTHPHTSHTFFFVLLFFRSNYEVRRRR
jgi:hypothetical protein